jgi:hypothetical protein
MAITTQILGQAKPSAATNTMLFTVAGSNSVEFSIYINNQSQVYDGYSIALIPYGQTGPAAQQYLALNTQIAGGATAAFSGLYLNSGDSVIVASTAGNCSFTATGIDFSP